MGKSKYGFFNARQIKPGGWMLRQLETEAEGLAGNLDLVWPDVRDSKWIGGTREGWERVPYWLDGFIPLACLLDREDMKARAARYMDAILSQQQPDGWICPCEAEKRPGYDIWALFLICKVMTVYYSSTGDSRIPGALYRAMKNCHAMLKSGQIKLFNWGKARWFEAFITIAVLIGHYGEEEWLTELAAMIREQGTDYSLLTESWKTPLNKWTQQTHIVNLMMMLKYEAVSCCVLGEEYKDEASRLFGILSRYNGTPVGTCTGDECLSGLSPIQGTELCSVVEEMYSLEILYAYTGEAKWAELLEKVAFNALPAALSDDTWTHQYVQMSNQIDCSKFPGKSVFRTNGPEAHIFGLEPHFGCCTANFGQGWPKLMLSAFMKTENGIISAVPLPGRVDTEINGVRVSVSLSTDYPFENSFDYTVTAEKPVRMRLDIRIPSFASGISVCGEEKSNTGLVSFDKEWRGTETLHIEYTVKPQIKRTPSGLYNAVYGSLLFSLPVKYRTVMREYVKNDVERKFPYCDYDYVRDSEWAFAFADKNLGIPQHRRGDGVPFSSSAPPLIINASLVPIDWGYADGYQTVCAKKPAHCKPAGKIQTLPLVPYGCAKLRMTEMPFAARAAMK